MTTTPDFRARCKELTEVLSKYQDILEETYHPDSAEAEVLSAGFRVLERAEQALATPPPEPPTDDELDELFIEIDQSGESQTWRPFARAVLERWG